MKNDVLLFHPPAIYDYRNRPIFPGILGSTVEQIQFSKVPIGMLSIADYLDRHGYRVLVDNLADRMIGNKNFDIEEHIKNSSADIYGIDLHWHHHSQGAIEIAGLCKKLHPTSVVVLGGLTATYFHEEIVNNYEFIDAVIRGEAEKPFLELVRNLEKYGEISKTPNLTFRDDNNRVCTTPLMPPSENLDEFEFIRFDLLEPKTSVFDPGMQQRWSLAICRGCKYNCVTCGGSAYSYKKYFGMKHPSFRSPSKIVGDMKKLNIQGFNRIGLYQDPRMAGEQYWKELMSTLRKEKINIEQLTMDLLAPADEGYIREIATIGKPVVLYICPDTGNCNIRKAQGRNYSNEDLLNTVKLCHRYHIPVTSFFSIGLAGETDNTIEEMWNLWDQLCTLDRYALSRGAVGGVSRKVLEGGPIIGPIILEPGALAFDDPDKYGYKLVYKTLKEYIDGLSQPSWHQWLNHETKQLNRNDLVKLILNNMEQAIYRRTKNGLYSKQESSAALIKTRIDKMTVLEINRIMGLSDSLEKEKRLNSFKTATDSLLNPSSWEDDAYGYRKLIVENCFHG